MTKKEEAQNLENQLKKEYDEHRERCKELYERVKL